MPDLPSPSDDDVDSADDGVVDRAADSRVVVAIDQGTSSTKVVVVDGLGVVIARASAPLGQSHPQPGWVEQDAEGLFTSVVTAVENALLGLDRPIAAIGLSTQRESAVVWDRSSGAALGPVLGWQDRRTASAAQALHAAGHDDAVRTSTGLPIDPMFSALKFAWLLDSVDPDRSRSSAGQIALGTVDSWIVFRLTGEHRIEVGNASRTQLLDLDTGDWNDNLLGLFGVPRAALPVVVSSIEPSVPVAGVAGIGPDVRITGVLGDSHAALYGHGARTPGAVKVTYGTGSSIMGLLPEGRSAGVGLVRTIAWSTGVPAQAFEGNILSTGSTVVWLAGVLGITPAEVFALAEAATDSGGVDLVPAFSGLGAPWWDDAAQAVIAGVGLGTTREHLACAAVESIALQIDDVLRAADAGTGSRVATILADGGPSSNRWLMQLQADLSQRSVVPADVAELSALGAAHLAGTSVGLWSDADVLGLGAASASLEPHMDAAAATERHDRWLSAVARSRTQNR